MPKELTEAQDQQRQGCHAGVGWQREAGGAKLGNQQLLHATLYVADQGCEWWGLPAT
ncbi:MAG: hypothetical protein ACP5E5_13310 [Acidobacteriaceae bacterium]